MDFTNLEGTAEQHFLTRQDTELRRTLYEEFAKTNSLSQFYSSILKRFKEYINDNVLQTNHNGDILFSFFEENKCRSTMKEIRRIPLSVQVLSHPLFSVINVSQEITTKSNKIGYQHLYMLSDTSSSESLDTSDSDSDLGSWNAAAARLKKKFIRCQQAIEVDWNIILESYKNKTIITGTAVHMDILIFLDKSVCKKLAEYLGLIYVEDVVIDAEENDMDEVISLLDDNAKLFSLIQCYINKNLISGRNNICLVHTLTLWENFRANARGVISIKGDEECYIKATETANFCVELGEHSSLIDHVEAVALIINKALSYETHVIAKYQCDEDSYCTIKLPLISILPLYVLHYFTQSKIMEKNYGSI